MQQLADAEGLTLKRGPSGIGGRKRATAESAPAVTGGVTSIPPGTSPAVAVLLAAADMTARGYTVFMPLTKTTAYDFIAVDRNEKIERVVVSRARRAGEEIRYDDLERVRADRRALVLTDEPVNYEPAMPGARRKRSTRE